LVYFVGIWYIFLHFGMLYQKNLATLYKTESKPGRNVKEKSTLSEEFKTLPKPCSQFFSTEWPTSEKH
jgi:hypothetical protein